MKKKDLRINRSIDFMRDRNGATVRELALALEVSEMTVRRDIELLRVNNIVTVNHGVIFFNPDAEKTDVNSKYHVIHEQGVNDEEKDRIGKMAAKFIEPGDTIIIDAGTTTEKLARYIPHNCPITVLCYTLNTLNEIGKKNVKTLLFGGGYYHYNSQMFESEESIHLIKRTRANKVFLAACGVSDKLGLTCANLYEVSSKASAIESSVKRILLVDYSKFGMVESAFFSSLDAIDTVITDSNVPPEWVELLAKRNIEVVLA